MTEKSLFNFKNDHWETVNAAPKDWAAYIPQHPAAQGLYRVLVARGHKPIDAAEEVLLACIGEKANGDSSTD
jgi:hypothetical protein